MDTQFPVSPSRCLALISELNNVLQVIAGTTEQIEQACDPDGHAKEYFEMMRGSVLRAAEVGSQLLAESGNVNGKILYADFPRNQSEAPPVVKNALHKRIMVVDDEKMLLILAGEVLREAGYSVVTAQSGFECLELFRAAPRSFDLVLLDLSMPLMDGEETFRRLRALRQDVRVMLCTGFVHQARLNHMLEAGLSGFLQKPLAPKDYVARVRAALAGAALENTNVGSHVLSRI
ncbi:MAG TPA: response regulator [Chthoniobacterales bacterium]|nr:response regulator [Chthoniobacterales bacterium]